MATKPTPFDYISSREFLVDAYSYEKSEWAGFSHRYIEQKIGASAGNFCRILNGAQRLRIEKLDRLAKVFHLKADERDFLNLLVRAEVAEGDAKLLLFQELLELRGIRLQLLEGEQFGIYGAWYLPVLRELIALLAPQWTDQQIGNLLKPAISAELVSQAKSRLLELGILKLTENGKYIRSEKMISSGPKPQLALRHYANEGLALARRALVEEDLAERELAFITLSLSPKTHQIVLEKSRQFRKELMELSALDQKPSKVIQVQLHILPVTKTWNCEENN